MKKFNIAMFFVLLSACGGNDSYGTVDPAVCASGTTQSCLGPGACEGAQICDANGNGWGECICGSEPVLTTGTGGVGNIPGSSGGSTSSSGGTTFVEGSGGGTSCTPKTCEQIASDLVGGWIPTLETPPNACDWVSDGCGGLINCGACLEGTCGSSGNEFLFPATNNICPTRCEKYTDTDLLTDSCDKQGHPGKHRWNCGSSIPPVGPTGCINLNLTGSTFPSSWCCDPN